MPDPIAEIKSGDKVPLKVDQNDPELAAQMEAFIRNEEAAGRPVEGEPDMPRKPQVTIPPDDAHLQPTPTDQIMTEALLDVTKVEVTDLEKDLYIKALLNEVPFRSTVTLYGGQLSVDLRSRSHYEQKRMFDILRLDQKEGIILDTDIAMFMTRSQEYCATLMIERWNGNLFSEIHLNPGNTLEEDAKLLRDFLAKNLNVNTIRWTTMLNVLRIFEAKCAKLNTMAANEDFWRPRATV